MTRRNLIISIANLLAVAFAALALWAAFPHGAAAHTALSGWKYPFSCCSGHDCRQVSAEAVMELPGGYRIVSSGEIVGYDDDRVKHSPDGEYHWCSVAGKDDGRTICLFVPGRLF